MLRTNPVQSSLPGIKHRIATFGQNKPENIDWLKIKINVFEFESNFFEFGMASRCQLSLFLLRFELVLG